MGTTLHMKAINASRKLIKRCQMNKKILAVFAAGFIIGIAVTLFFQPARYKLYNSGRMTFRMDTLTGKVWLYRPDRKEFAECDVQ